MYIHKSEPRHPVFATPPRLPCAPRTVQALVRNEANRGGPMWNILFNSGGYSSPQDILNAMDSAFATSNPIRFLQVSASFATVLN